MENGNLSYFYYNANRASTSGTNNVSNSYQWYEYQYNQLNIRSSAHLNSRWIPYSVVSEYNTAVHGKAMMKNTSHKVQRKIVYKIKAINPANLFGRDENRKVFCSYCRKIGGHRFLYEDHQLKNEDGKILCPILKEDGCFLCDATGDKVHLPKECPKNSVNTNLKN